MGKERKGKILVCKACEKEFYVAQCRIGKAKFCSTKCSSDFKYGKKENRSCKKCGVEYMIDKNNISKAYCSVACYKDRGDSSNDFKYLLYRTINTVNNKEYIGVHKTCHLGDGYIGSGIKSQADANYRKNREGIKSPFINAVVKHGYENFKREILFIYESYQEVLDAEAKIITLEYVNKSSNYNAQVGGGQISISCAKDYDLTDNKGVRYEGNNISDFCRINNLTYSNINRLVIGDLKTSQGFQRTCDYIKPKIYIIVNIETSEVFKTTNIKEWCEDNEPKLIKGKNLLLWSVLNKNTNLALRKWWICKEEDWTGQVVYLDRRLVVNRKIKLVDEEGNEYLCTNVASFCKNNKLNLGYFYGMVKGKYKKCKNFKLA